MAGAGYKLFTTGSVLTAADVNTYLAEQTVMVFADAAARTAALSGVVSEGMISYLKDTNAVEVYNGSAWVASDDPNAIQNTIVDAKGDLITATAADTPARLAVGNNGETLVADSSASTGLRWQGNFAAGKNKLINGDFGIWQRGTSLTSTINAYTTDRWIQNVSGTTTVSQQSTGAPIGSRYYARVAGSSVVSNIGQLIETNIASTLWGRTVTLSGKIRRNSSLTQNMSAELLKSSTVDAGIGATWVSISTVDLLNVNIPTGTGSSDWLSFSLIATVPNDGTANSLYVRINSGTMSSGAYYEIAQMQLEAGNVATAFQTATGTLAGELAACQRYYFRTVAGTSNGPVATTGFSTSTTAAVIIAQHPVKMRTSPTSVDFANVQIQIPGASSGAVTALTLSQYNEQTSVLAATTTGLTANLPGYLRGNSDATGYFGVNAEL